MNIRVLFADFLLAEMLSLSAQEYLLPIGENVDRRNMEFYLGLGDADTGVGFVNRQVSYTPQLGKELKTVLEENIQEMARAYLPPTGMENDIFILAINNPGPGPYTSDKFFKLQKSGDRWVIPPEVLEVDLKYGSVVVPIMSVSDVEMEVRGEERTEVFSTITGTGGTACRIASTVDGFFGISLSREYTVPKYREGWWTEGEVTLYESDLWARFNILNGWLIETSSEPPAFLSQLKVEPLPPRITSIRRIEDTTEITVESESAVVLEFSENGKDWSMVSYPTLTIQSVGSRILSHKSSSSVGFYRVRLVETPTQK